MWAIDEIVAAISGSSATLSRVGEVTLGLWDSTLRIGVGSTPEGKQVLVLPAQPDVAAFRKKFATYDPFYSAQVIGAETVQGNFAILNCDFDLSDGFQLSTLAGVFLGLIDVQVSFGDAGISIWSMKRLFEYGLMAPDSDSLTGLIGEMAVICAATSKANAVDSWHSTTDSVYDFSFGNKRLEVKTTRTLVRSHFFSSHQLPPATNATLIIASVLIPVVETGNSFSDLYELAIAGLPADKKAKVLDQVIKTVGVPPSAVTGIIFDLVGLTSSIRYFDHTEIPIPTAPTAVISMKWESNLEGLTKLLQNPL